MITETVTCDGCGKQKGEVNHWWMFRKVLHSPSLLTAGIDFPIMQVAPWTADAHREFYHACGQECLVKALSEWMAETAKRG